MSANGDRRYRLKPAALRDLEDIWTFGAERWSPDQADRYIIALSEVLQRIAGNPRIARERHEFTPSIRIVRHEAHVIVYLEEGDGVTIVRIRHGREDWISDPAEAG